MSAIAAPPETAIPQWDDPARARAFDHWLRHIAPRWQLLPGSVHAASSDASFRRYFRVEAVQGATRIIMDAPPAHEDNSTFVHVARLMRDAGLRAPEVLDWDERHGFLLLSDLGRDTMMQALGTADVERVRALYLQAIDALLKWQQASHPGVLPSYDAALLQRELALFPDWYVARHRGIQLDSDQQQVLQRMFDLIVQHNLAAPQVFVHRDFMPRNLIVADGDSGSREPLGVLDFQDAVWGPVTYDIASLMRDAFVSWDEEFVLDITIRYWERARKFGLLAHDGWDRDFAAFWRAVEWMGLQRHLKVAGIFARLTLRDGKPRYLADAPRFIAYIRHITGRYRELQPLLRLVDAIEGSSGAETGWSFGRMS